MVVRPRYVRKIAVLPILSSFVWFFGVFLPQKRGESGVFRRFSLICSDYGTVECDLFATFEDEIIISVDEYVQGIKKSGVIVLTPDV